MKYQAFLGTDEFLYSGEAVELCEKMQVFFESTKNSTSNNETFEIIEESIDGLPLFYASVIFPNWAEALFLIKFYEYNWELMEESE